MLSPTQILPPRPKFYLASSPYQTRLAFCCKWQCLIIDNQDADADLYQLFSFLHKYFLRKNENMMLKLPGKVVMFSPSSGNIICFLIYVLTSSGNITCFLVFSKNQKMDLKPSFINILRCLSVFDTLFLVNFFQFRL